jgi:hypothetical protein
MNGTQTIIISQIEEQLRQLPKEKLVVVYDFVSYLVERDGLERADIAEGEWLKNAAKNPTFDFLKESEEDIYSPTDGKPFHDQR